MAQLQHLFFFFFFFGSVRGFLDFFPVRAVLFLGFSPVFTSFLVNLHLTAVYTFRQPPSQMLRHEAWQTSRGRGTVVMLELGAFPDVPSQGSPDVRRLSR